MLDKGGYHKDDLETYRQQAIDAARDLRYLDDVVDQIYSAASAEEISRIMTTARNSGLQTEKKRRSISDRY